jgi:hypothetical protein
MFPVRYELNTIELRILHTECICVFHMLQTGTSRDRVPMMWIFSNLPNPSGPPMALGSTQPLTEMSTRNLPVG